MEKKMAVVPSKEEIAAMGCDESMCAGCIHYAWTHLMGEWYPLDGQCSMKILLCAVRADTPKCMHFVPKEA